MAAGVRLTGLWWKKGQNGKDYLEGMLGMATIRVYINEPGEKQSDKSPDASIVLAEKPKPGAPGGGGGQRQQYGGQQPSNAQRGAHPYAPKPPNLAPGRPGKPEGEDPPWSEEDMGF